MKPQSAISNDLGTNSKPPNFLYYPLTLPSLTLSLSLSLSFILSKRLPRRTLFRSEEVQAWRTFLRLTKQHLLYCRSAFLGELFSRGSSSLTHIPQTNQGPGYNLNCTSCLDWTSSNFGLPQLGLRKFPYVLISTIFCASLPFSIVLISPDTYLQPVEKYT
jgi:hypothetical protein